MKVLLNDGMDKEGIAIFEEEGIEVDTVKRNPKELIEIIGEYDALCVRSATYVGREVIESGSRGRLKVIGRAGVGVENIELEVASDNGVLVKYAPGGNTEAAAEMALALMLSISRYIAQAHQSLKAGKWKKKSFEGTELANKTLGIIGCGRIGQRLADLVIGFNMRVIGYDPVIRDDSRIKYLPKVDVLKEADYLSIHTGGNNVIIGEAELSQMKADAYLINV